MACANIPDVSEPSALARASALAPLLKALSDEHRLALVMLLADAPRTVRELQDATGLRQTLVSHHLKALRERGLVSVTPDGRSNRYELCCDALAGPVRSLSGLVSDASRAA